MKIKKPNAHASGSLINGRLLGIEPRLAEPQPAVLPLNYSRHIPQFPVSLDTTNNKASCLENNFAQIKITRTI